MLKELFESIVSQAHKSKEPEQPVVFTNLSSSEREVYFVYDGKLEHHTLDPPPRNHRASSAADLVTLILACEPKPSPPLTGEDSDVKTISTARAERVSSAMIFVGDSHVLAFLDEERLNRVTLPLLLSQHFMLLKSLPKSLNQKDSIAFLRRGFAGTGLENYVNLLRQVVFERQQVAAGVSQRNQESMGRSIETRVSGTADLPEFLRGEISVYDESVFSAHWSVELGCDPRLSEELFDFWLPPDALSLGLLSAQLQLCAYLRDALPGATVVRGTE